jgi:spermidine synthase
MQSPRSESPPPGFVHAAAILTATFLCGWALMSVEILGGRVLAPNFGSDVFTWGSLISTFLVALSIGYLAGGQLSRGKARLGGLALMVGIGGALVVAVALCKDPVSDRVFAMDLGDRLGPLTASIALFGLPAVVLGMISPYCVRLYSTRLEHVGATSGFLYAVSTVGSTLGTLVTSFFLIPSFGVHEIFVITGSVLIGLAVVLALLTLAGRPRTAVVGLLLGTLLVGPVSARERLIFEKESPYTRVTVVEDGSVRILRFARKGVNTEESRMDVRHPLVQLNEYTAMMFAGLVFDPEPRDVLVVGLGGGVVPETLHAYYPNARIDVVEIDPVVVEAAEKCFLFKPDDRMRVFTQDGRVFTKRAAKRYDLIFLDAFQGRSIPFHLKTREFFRELAAILRPGGVVVSNLHRGPRLYDSERATYALAFGSNYGFAGTASGNLILVSSPSAGPPLPKSVVMSTAARLQARHRFVFDLTAQARKMQERPDWSPDARPLTDDYAPVETLNHR